METTTTRPRNSPPAPPPKPKSKSPYNNGSDHQQTSYDEHVNNNVENFYQNHQTNNNNNSNGNGTSINNNHQHYYSSLPPSHEQVVMTPRGKTSNSTVILIERKLVEEVSDRVHVAGGDHQGIIINKDIVKGEQSSSIAWLTSNIKLASLQIKSPQKLLRIWRSSSECFWWAPRQSCTHKSQEQFGSGSVTGSPMANERLKSRKTFSVSSSAQRNFPEVWFDSINSIAQLASISFLILLRLCRLHQEDYEADAERLQWDSISRDWVEDLGANISTAIASTWVSEQCW